jgi:hypothetical protein
MAAIGSPHPDLISHPRPLSEFTSMNAKLSQYILIRIVNNAVSPDFLLL